ncbi:hypothetical protein FRC17_007773 [Serendipita sp. 399]|nr:hypothetical protein FRC17_007773 [Serendipita sp. 399]
MVIIGSFQILLLGSGDSGKTTIMKQMRLIADGAFTCQELESYRQLVFSNLITGIKAIVECLPEIGLSIENDKEAAEAFKPNYFPTNQDAIQTRARTVGIIETIFRVPEGGFGAPRQGLLQHHKDISKMNMTGDVSDAVMATRKATSLASEESSTADVLWEKENKRMLVKTRSRDGTGHGMRELKFVDVGGQRSERRKWIHCFQDVTAVMFLVPLSGYDQCIIEERSMNQMTDAMTIWEGICTAEWFKDTSLILFLNKEDLFASKLATSPIHHFFPDYEGDPKGDVQAGKEYFKRRFLRIAQKGDRQLQQQFQQQLHMQQQLTSKQVVPC